MTTRAEIIRKSKEILLEAIGYAEVKSDTDAYSLALRTLVDYAMEAEDLNVLTKKALPKGWCYGLNLSALREGECDEFGKL